MSDTTHEDGRLIPSDRETERALGGLMNLGDEMYARFINKSHGDTVETQIDLQAVELAWNLVKTIRDSAVPENTRTEQIFPLSQASIVAELQKRSPHVSTTILSEEIVEKGIENLLVALQSKNPNDPSLVDAKRFPYSDLPVHFRENDPNETKYGLYVRKPGTRIKERCLPTALPGIDVMQKLHMENGRSEIAIRVTPV